MFPLFLKRTADVLAPRLTVVFRRIRRLGSLPVCCKVANVTPIPRGPPSSSAANFLHTYIYCPRCLRVWRQSVRHGRFMELIGLLPTTRFAYRKCIGTCDALLCVAHILQSSWRWGWRLEWFRTTSVLQLPWLIIKGLSPSSVL